MSFIVNFSTLAKKGSNSNRRMITAMYPPFKIPVCTTERVS